MKATGITIVVVVLIGLGIAWLVTTSLDRTIAQAIEEVGSDLLDSRLDVASVKTDLREGSASIFGLEVSNPEGDGLVFSSDPAFELGEITVAIDIAGLADGPIPITLVRVLAPRLNAEVTPGGINFLELRDRVNSGSAEPSSADDSQSGEPTRLRIDAFEFMEGSIRANTEGVGGDVRELKLPAVKLTNLSGTPSEIGKQVLDFYLGKAIKAMGAGRIEAEVDKQVKQVKKKAKKELGAAARSLLGGD